MNRRSFIFTASAAPALIAAGVAAAAPTRPGEPQAIAVSYLEDLAQDAVMRGDVHQATFLDILAQEDLLQALPFLTVSGGALERAEPFTTIAPRDLDMLRPIGGDCVVDAALVDAHGVGVVTLQRKLHYRKAARTLVDRLINGDGSAAYGYAVGLKQRIAENAVLDMGGRLQLSVLEGAIEQTQATHMVASKRMRNLMAAASSQTTARRFIEWDIDSEGRRVSFYTTRKGRKVRILCTDYNEDEQQIIDFNEPGDTTSIYVVALRPSGVVGLMNDRPVVADLGLIASESVHRTRVDWLVEGSILGNHAAIRLAGIGKTAVKA